MRRWKTVLLCVGGASLLLSGCDLSDPSPKPTQPATEAADVQSPTAVFDLVFDSDADANTQATALIERSIELRHQLSDKSKDVEKSYLELFEGEALLDARELLRDEGKRDSAASTGFSSAGLMAREGVEGGEKVVLKGCVLNGEEQEEAHNRLYFIGFSSERQGTIQAIRMWDGEDFCNELLG